MPRTPTILSEGLQGSTPIPEVSRPPSPVMSTAGDSVARSALMVADAAQEWGQQLQAVNQRKKLETDLRWVGETTFSIRNDISHWQADPVNNTSEDYDVKLQEYSTVRLREAERNAPSKEAAQNFRLRMYEDLDTRIGNASIVTQRTRLENTKQSMINRVGVALDDYRTSQSVPGDEGVKRLLSDHEVLKSDTSILFEHSPSTARVVRGYIDTEFAVGIAKEHQGIAKNLVETSSDIDEADKPAIINKIESLGEVSNLQNLDNFQKLVEDHLVMVKNGKARNTIGLDQYIAAGIKPDKAKSLKTKHDEIIAVFNDTNDKFDELAPLNANTILIELGKLGDAKTKHQEEVYQSLLPRIKEVIKLQQEDPGSFLQQHNPEVKDWKQVVETLATTSPEQAMAARASMIYSMLKYQGPAPAGASDPERYLNLPTGARHVLSAVEAKSLATQLNQSSPTEFIQKLEGMLSSYTEDHQYRVFADAVTMPGKDEGLNQAYQLVWQNKDQWWIKSFISAMQGGDVLPKLTDEKRGDFEKELEGNGSWMKFQSSMIGARTERKDQISGFRTGVLTFANYFAVKQGLNAKKSVEKATDLLVNSTMGFTAINGKPLMVPLQYKERAIPRTEFEVQDMGRRLGVALSKLDPRWVDQSTFEAIQSIHPDPENIDRLQALRDIITSKGFFVPENDGETVSLYVTGAAGIEFQLRDKEGKAFIIKYTDLPEFTTIERVSNRPTGTALPIPGKHQEKIKEQPKTKVPLKETTRFGGSVLGFDASWLGTTTTNWPTANEYFQRAIIE